MIHIIYGLGENEYTREDGQLVEKWLVSHGEDIADEIEKRRMATADMSEEAFRHLEVPTWVAAESRLGRAMIKMAEQAPETFALLFVVRGGFVGCCLQMYLLGRGLLVSWVWVVVLVYNLKWSLFWMYKHF